MPKDATLHEVDEALQKAWKAFHQYRKLSLQQRANFMRAIATELDNCSSGVIETAMQETNLPEIRLQSEKKRTVFQLNSYADYCEQGTWLEARIDTAITDKNPPKPDIRKMLVPLGPVVVFGSSNFPFAYSTAGGDTACAFAAGCPVIIKGHPAHAKTSVLAAELIKKAVDKCGMPEGVFTHLYGASFEVGKALVKHPFTKAVGFTGSYTGGKQLLDWGNERTVPIPVFAEMGSTNPVFLLPEKLKMTAADTARMYAASITLSVGQFCTNPGLLIGIEGTDLEEFTTVLRNEIKNVMPGKMLHPGIAKQYAERKKTALAQAEVTVVAMSDTPADELSGLPTIATTTAQAFLHNPVLQEEVFGPYTLIIRCKNMDEMTEVAKHLPGQLTCTLIATENELATQEELIEAVKNICGRLILNGVPTGVEVCLSMQHGGPFPATTDARFTAVGADGIKRFARPVAFQSWANNLLPNELKNENPLGIYRTVNNELSKEKL